MGKKILYVGGFILPDKNAAAQRVVSIAKILRDLEYEVIFLNKSPYAEENEWKEIEYFGFKCYECRKETKKKNLIKELCSIKYIEDFLKKLQDVSCVIAYNFPAIALNKLNKLCRKNGIKCIGDVTEWYGSKGRSLLYKVIKGFDTSYRMKKVHKELTGNIVISDFLESYYQSYVPVVNIPPLVDKTDSKWNVCKKQHNDIRFTYAGSPSSEKERLDLIVNAISELSREFDVNLSVIGVTEEQFLDMYQYDPIKLKNCSAVRFLGRIPHEDVISEVANSDYTIIIRDNNLVNTAGFPTKFAESISCGTAVIANDSSCIAKYFSNGENGVLISELTIKEDLDNILKQNMHLVVKEDLFDYRNYIEPLKKFMEDCNV